MVQIEILTLTLVITAIMVTIGLVFKKQFFWWSLAGSILLIITGIQLFTSGIFIPTGSITTIINSTASQANLVYTQQNPILDNVIAWIITLTGFVILTMSSIQLNEERYKPRKNEDE